MMYTSGVTYMHSYQENLVFMGLLKPIPSSPPYLDIGNLMKTSKPT